jgi:hypothetical protein
MTISKWLFEGILTIYGLSLPIHAQNPLLNTYGNITLQASSCSGPGAGYVYLALPSNASAVAVTVSGTWSGTLQFVGSVNGSAWTSVNASPLPSGDSVTSTTANGTYTISPGGLTQVCVYASSYASGTASVNASVQTAAQTGILPGGSDTQIQWNSAGAFAGASGGTTNGTHFAFGAGSAVDNGPITFPDGTPLSPKVINSISETYAGADLENGEYLNLALNPASPPTNAAYGSYHNLTALGSNWTTANEFIGGVAEATYGGSGTGASGFQPLAEGMEGVVVNLSTGEMQNQIGVVSNSVNISTGLVDQAEGAQNQVFNTGGGTVSAAQGVQSVIDNISGTISSAQGIQTSFISSAGTTIDNEGVKITSPSLSGGQITTNIGLDIQQQCVVGVTACYGIDQEASSDPNYLAGALRVAGALSDATATTTNTDNRGRLTLTAGTVSYTFTAGPTSGAWTTAPICQAQDQTFANQIHTTLTVSGSTLTIANSVGTTDTYTYHCDLGN